VSVSINLQGQERREVGFTMTARCNVSEAGAPVIHSGNLLRKTSYNATKKSHHRRLRSRAKWVVQTNNIVVSVNRIRYIREQHFLRQRISIIKTAAAFICQ